MIKSARDKRTASFLSGEKIREFQAFERQVQRRIAILNEVTCIEDLMRLPSNRFKALGGDRTSLFSTRINDQWRICFTFHDGDAYDVEIVDCH